MKTTDDTKIHLDLLAMNLSITHNDPEDGVNMPTLTVTREFDDKTVTYTTLPLSYNTYGKMTIAELLSYQERVSMVIAYTLYPVMRIDPPKARGWDLIIKTK